MTVSCPDCGSRYLHVSECRSPWEWLRHLVGVSPLRCGDCGNRFVARTWNLAGLTHSRCPRCLRTDLNTWTEERYPPDRFAALLIKLGAYRWRCEYCSHNFVDFRPRRETFSVNRWREFNRSRDRKPAREEAADPGIPDTRKGGN
jgi:DNA-directed RNA polymerase subunit RPC12/RpoP